MEGCQKKRLWEKGHPSIPILSPVRLPNKGKEKKKSRDWEKEAFYIPKTTFQKNGSQVLEKDTYKNYIFTVVRHF